MFLLRVAWKALLYWIGLGLEPEFKESNLEIVIPGSSLIVCLIFAV